MKQIYDFFTLTGLSFDPPDKSQRRVEKAISEAASKISSKLGHETQQHCRDALQAQVNFLNQQSALINTVGWIEASKHFSAMAEQRKQREQERVQFVASLLVQNGITSLNEGVVRSFRQKTGLSVETLKQSFLQSGIELSSDAFYSRLPKFPAYGERILIDLDELRATKDPNPNGPDTSRVTDLYVFAAYLMDDLGHADLYKNLSTSELKTIFDLAARKYSCRNDNLGKLCGSISALASHNVFNSDDSRKGYEALMLYHHVALQSLFDALKMLPSGILLQPDFAEKCIKLIGVFFPDYETALSIYNKEGNLAEVPYVPQENSDTGADVYHEDKIIAPKCSKSRVYGIDLGTTYSSISTLDDDGHANVIMNWADGSEVLASAVYFPQGSDPIVGEIAKSQKDIEPERVVEFMTQYLGKSDAPTYEFDGVSYDPITITALILLKMKSYAEEQGHDVRDVIIACPAYYGYAERNAIKQAGMIAGLNVLNIINTTTAATLYYLSDEEMKENKRVLVYDLGGATFNLSLLEIQLDSNGNPNLKVIKTDGNEQLGGCEWDARLFDCLLRKYAYENGLDNSDLDDELRATITMLVEKIKMKLSTFYRASCRVHYCCDHTRLEITREEFEELSQDLVQQTIDYVHKLLLDVKLKANNVDTVLLVGGSTRMPMIRNAVEAIFPGRVRGEDSNLAISKGAALCSKLLLDFYEVQPNG